MGIENNYIVSNEKSTENVEPTALAERVKKLIPALFRLETSGLEHLDEIPPGKRVIFLTTHMSDYDVPIAIAALADKFPRLKVAESSTHETFSQNPGGFIGRHIGGVENSFSVDFTGGGSGDGKAVFNPQNFESMKGALEEGNAIVIAAYFDTTYNNKTWKLPNKGGSGGVYLGQITPDAVLVPVAIDIKSKKAFGMGDPGIGQIIRELRPKVEVRIGKPIVPDTIEGIERFSTILNMRKNGDKLSPEDREDFSRIHNAMKTGSEAVMSSLSEMLPPEKQSDSQIKQIDSGITDTKERLIDQNQKK